MIPLFVESSIRTGVKGASKMHNGESD